MSEIELSLKEREPLARALQTALAEETDLDIGNMEALMLLDRLIPSLGNAFYNRGLRDAAKVITRRTEDMGDDLYALELPDPTDR